MKYLIDKWIKNKVVTDYRVIEAFMKFPREDFVLSEYKHEANNDYPLPILCGQTISQPTTVAIMLNALEVKEGSKVLEIGTGSGWVTAMLSYLTGEKGKVISIEYFKELYKFAKTNLEKFKLKYKFLNNIILIHGDGSKGYKKYAPYDRIIVNAACSSINKYYIEQLKDKGILIIPVGSISEQKMLRIKKDKGKISVQELGSFVFVPLRGESGF